MAQINSTILRKEVAAGYGAKVLKDTAQGRVEQIFDDAVKGMKTEFELHPVTREIAGGIESSNISNTLRGGPAPENLYSFIGFYAGGGDETEPIRETLEPGAEGGPSYEFVGKDPSNPLVFKFKVNSPDLDVIYRKTPMPWGSGMSWAEKIESTIQDFARFLPSFSRPQSHSGGGVQVKGEKPLRPGASYKKPEERYLTKIFENFIERVKSSTKKGYRLNR